MYLSVNKHHITNQSPTELVSPRRDIFLFHYAVYDRFRRFRSGSQSPIQRKSGKVCAVQFIHHGRTRPSGYVFQFDAGRSAGQVPVAGD